jgi:hypothetical protein
MFKKLLLSTSFLITAFGYDAKVLPFDSYTIKSSVAGSVIYANKNLEGKNVKNALVVKIDDFNDKSDLQNIRNQINILKEEIQNQKQIVKRKYDTYLRYEKLKTKSKQEKDLKFYDYIASKNQLLSLKSQLSNLIDNENKLLDNIRKKNIKVSGYVYKILVDKGSYVAPGTPIVEIDDISKEKLYIYVPIGKTESLKNKTVYINGKKSDFRIVKIWKVSDSEYITSYKVELVGNGLKIGDIVKVKLKE